MNVLPTSADPIKSKEPKTDDVAEAVFNEKEEGIVPKHHTQPPDEDPILELKEDLLWDDYDITEVEFEKRTDAMIREISDFVVQIVMRLETLV